MGSLRPEEGSGATWRMARSVRTHESHACAVAAMPARTSSTEIGDPQPRGQRHLQRLHRQARRDEGQPGADPCEEGALVGETEARVRVLAVLEDRAREASAAIGRHGIHLLLEAGRGSATSRSSPSGPPPPATARVTGLGATSRPATLLLAGLFWTGLWLVLEWVAAYSIGRPVDEILVAWHVERATGPYVLLTYVLALTWAPSEAGRERAGCRAPRGRRPRRR